MKINSFLFYNLLWGRSNILCPFLKSYYKWYYKKCMYIECAHDLSFPWLFLFTCLEEGATSRVQKKLLYIHYSSAIKKERKRKQAQTNATYMPTTLLSRMCRLRTFNCGMDSTHMWERIGVVGRFIPKLSDYNFPSWLISCS